MIIQMVAAFLAVLLFSITLEINKKFLIFGGITGMIGWFVYLICGKLGLNDIICYLLSGISITLTSYIFARAFKVLVTIFLLPGILPIVPGAAIYRTVYYLIMGDLIECKTYLIQTILISGSIAVSIFLIGSIFTISKDILKRLNDRKVKKKA